jgi:hypothetical protein
VPVVAAFAAFAALVVLAMPGPLAAPTPAAAAAAGPAGAAAEDPSLPLAALRAVAPGPSAAVPAVAAGGCECDCDGWGCVGGGGKSLPAIGDCPPLESALFGLASAVLWDDLPPAWLNTDAKSLPGSLLTELSEGTWLTKAGSAAIGLGASAAVAFMT